MKYTLMMILVAVLATSCAMDRPAVLSKAPQSVPQPPPLPPPPTSSKSRVAAKAEAPAPASLEQPVITRALLLKETLTFTNLDCVFVGGVVYFKFSDADWGRLTNKYVVTNRNVTLFVP